MVEMYNRALELEEQIHKYERERKEDEWFKAIDEQQGILLELEDF